MSLDGTYDDDNIFAKILRGDAPCVKVFEDEHVLAFMDIFPQSSGHFLVLPKAASRNLLELDDDALQATIVRVKRLANAAKSALEPDGIIVTQWHASRPDCLPYPFPHHSSLGWPVDGPSWWRPGRYGRAEGPGGDNRPGPQNPLNVGAPHIAPRAEYTDRRDARSGKGQRCRAELDGS